MKKAYLIYMDTVSYEWNGEEGSRHSDVFMSDEEKWSEVKVETPYRNLDLSYGEVSEYEYDEPLGNCTVEYYDLRVIEKDHERYLEIINDYNTLLNSR